jgi:hypothetical protein
MADKAAIFGVNEYKTVPSLNGCVNDVENMRSLLTSVFGFDPKNVRPFTDSKVTKAEVQRQMKWLFRDVGAGDRVVFHLSGHGSSIADKDGDEQDGEDEIFCLYDMDFDDPGSYLVDDELRDWTMTLPSGVHLTLILDTCHSGTGTRLLVGPGSDGIRKPVRVDDVATLKRTVSSFGANARGLEMAAAALNPDHPEVVRVRYVEPPQSVKDEIALARTKARSKARGFVKAPLNHVLLAACRDDQTAADATINGRPSGAFTYYLCEAIRSGGPGIGRQALIDQVSKSLLAGHFSQVAQLEAANPHDPLFPVPVAHVPGSTPPVPVATTGANDEGPGAMGLLTRIIGDGTNLDASARGQALDLLSRLVGSTSTTLAPARGVGRRTLVAVHGICQHLAGYSDPWWLALHPFTNVFGVGNLGDTRREVLWSDIVNQRGLADRGLRDPGDPRVAERAEFASRVRGVLEDRAATEGFEDAGTPAAARELLARDLEPTRGLSIPGLNCIDDFAAYMFDDSIRARVLARFTSVVRPLLASGSDIDIISHSWGTVVAYEGLRELEGGGFTTPLVRNFFTVGSALSLFPVKARLLDANKDGRKPAMVHRWINLDAHGDPVGGPLQGRPFQVDEEDLDMPNLGCSFFDPSCAHGSYFQVANVAVNRDIFARNINAV